MASFTWTINNSEKSDIETLKEIFWFTLEMYSIDPAQITEVQRFDITVTDREDKPVTSDQTVYVYQYGNKWFVLQ
jgi:hypothetical protein